MTNTMVAYLKAVRAGVGVQAPTHLVVLALEQGLTLSYYDNRITPKGEQYLATRSGV